MRPRLCVWLVVVIVALCPLIYLDGIRDAGDLGKRALLYLGGVIAFELLWMGPQRQELAERRMLMIPGLAVPLAFMAAVSALWCMNGLVPSAAAREFSG